MENTEIERLQKELDRLGIITIEANSGLSGELVQDSINSTQKLLNFLDLDAISADIAKEEAYIYEYYLCKRTRKRN